MEFLKAQRVDWEFMKIMKAAVGGDSRRFPRRKRRTLLKPGRMCTHHIPKLQDRIIPDPKKALKIYMWQCLGF